MFIWGTFIKLKITKVLDCTIVRFNDAKSCNKIKTINSPGTQDICTALLNSFKIGTVAKDDIHRREEIHGRRSRQAEKEKVQRSFFFPRPDPAAAVTGSASLCHISLRRSSQRLAGGIWPGSPSRRESWAEASARRSPGALPAERPRTSLASIAGGESGSRWGVGLPAPLLAPRCPTTTTNTRTPGRWGRRPRPTSTVSRLRQRRGEPGTEDGRWRRRRGERMTRGCRCELSGETLVQRIYGGEAAERKLLLLVIGSACTRLCSATVNRKRPKEKKKRAKRT